MEYLLKVEEIDCLPAQYILKRWTKVAKANGVKDLDGLEIKETNALVAKRGKLFHHASLVIDKVLTSSEEAHTIFIEALHSILDKLKQMQVHNNEGTSISKELACNVQPLQHRYNEPNEVRAKGCGKRNTKMKEKAKKKRSIVGSDANSRRKCHGCDLYGQKHDKRNCPALKKPEHRSRDPNQPSSFEEDDEE